jgi:hypothetical protein
MMCDNCIHKAVCSIYRATGGKKQCEHHKEERRGRWLSWIGKPIPKDDFRWSWTCSECKHEVEFEEAVTADEFASNFCPNCGADLRGTEDG